MDPQTTHPTLNPTTKIHLLAAQTQQNPPLALLSALKAQQTLSPLSQENAVAQTNLKRKAEQSFEAAKKRYAHKARASLSKTEMLPRAQALRNGEAVRAQKERADEALEGLVVGRREGEERERGGWGMGFGKLIG